MGLGPLTNLTNGGEGPSGYKHTEETKSKIREKRKMQVFSDEYKAKMSETLKGRKRPTEVCEKISKSNKGRIMSSEWKEKIRRSGMGKKNNIRKYIIETPGHDIIDVIGRQNVVDLIGCSYAFFERKTYKGYKLLDTVKINQKELINDIS